MPLVKTLGALVVAAAAAMPGCSPVPPAARQRQLRLAGLASRGSARPEQPAELDYACSSAKQHLARNEPQRARDILDRLQDAGRNCRVYQLVRAHAYSTLADKLELPSRVDKSIPEKEFLDRWARARQEKFNLYETAIESYTRAIELREDDHAWQCLAITHWQRGIALGITSDIVTAAGGLCRALELAPERTELNAILGGIYLRLALRSASAREQEQFALKAYGQFVSAREKNKQHPLNDQNLLEYVNQSIRELELVLPNDKKFH